MKKFIALAFALVWVLTLSSSTPAAYAQNPDEDDETFCGLYGKAATKGCAEATEAAVGAGPEDIDEVLRLAKRCIHLLNDYREWCIEDGDEGDGDDGGGNGGN